MTVASFERLEWYPGDRLRPRFARLPAALKGFIERAIARTPHLCTNLGKKTRRRGMRGVIPPYIPVCRGSIGWNKGGYRKEVVPIEAFKAPGGYRGWLKEQRNPCS